MTERRPDPLDDILSGLDVPPLTAGFADRVVAEAERVDRVRPRAFTRSRRPRARRWTRRGAWTAVLAINLVLASAVAAALGSGVIRAPHLVAAARHVVERLTHRGGPVPPHRQAVHPRPHALVSPRRQPTPPPRAVLPLPYAPSAPALRPLREEWRQPVPRPHLRGGEARFLHPAGARPGSMMLRPGWRMPPRVALTPRRFGAAGMPFERRRFAHGAGRRFGGPAIYGPRFDRFQAGPPRFRATPRFGAGLRGGFGRAWRGRRGGPRRRF